MRQQRRFDRLMGASDRQPADAAIHSAVPVQRAAQGPRLADPDGTPARVTASVTSVTSRHLKAGPGRSWAHGSRNVGPTASRPPGRREALLGSLRTGRSMSTATTCGTRCDRRAAKKPSPQPTSSTDAAWAERTVELAVIVDVDVPRFCHEPSLAGLSESARINAYVRTENDTWDIKTSVGSTALFVAAARALEAQKPDPAAVDPYAEVFCRAVGRRVGRCARRRRPRPPAEDRVRRPFRRLPGRSDQILRHLLPGRGRGRGAPDRAPCRRARLPWVPVALARRDGGLRAGPASGAGVQAGGAGRHGDAPTAERREVAVDLRNDWPQALRDNGFDPSKPSAWIAEGLLIYLPAAAQHQLFAGIDSLAAPGSHLAVEESVPLGRRRFRGQAGGGTRGWQRPHLLHARLQRAARARPRVVRRRGWWAVATPLPYQLRSLGRPVPAADTEAGFMTGNISLVSAIKD